ncbi:hypothetical protein [Evansella clarkii]|uniref:IS66 family transposase n=1 Tax=Evansella clarkii TaxID=79879 RepID=UPI000B437CB2|nr:hypothetical protein [Evansella clarkii]
MKTTNQTSQNTTEQLEKRVSSLEKQTESAAISAWYEEQLPLSKQRQFGTSSEKTPEGQLELPLFNEAEVCQNPEEEEPYYEEVTYYRKKDRRY